MPREPLWDKGLGQKNATPCLRYQPGIAKWQGQKDSNPQQRFWRPTCYHYTMPLKPTSAIIRGSADSVKKNFDENAVPGQNVLPLALKDLRVSIGTGLRRRTSFSREAL